MQPRQPAAQIHWVYTLMLTALLAALAATPAAAMPKNGQKFKDWVAACPKPPKGQKQRCFVMQNLALKSNGKQVLSMRVGYVKATNKPALIAIVPLGVFLPAGLSVKVDDGKPTRVPFQFCNKGGCTAAYALTDDQLKAMRNGKKAKVGFEDGRRHPVALPVSLSGFTAAFASLQ